ncbi:MAG: lamin tail domain-containing protein, partial [Pseudomonadota bacterium]
MPAVHAQAVISQAYGGGGNAGAPFTHDFVEIFNRGGSSVDLSGHSIQYSSSTGTSWTNKFDIPAGTVLAPGRYLLIQLAPGTGNGVALPTPDFIMSGTPINLSGTNGKVLLANTTTVQTGACPTGAQIVDFVGYGSANCFEGSAAVGVLSNTTAALRGGGGCTDNNQNGTDFTVAAPAPRNSATAAAPCGGGGTPALSINDVSVVEGNSGTTIATLTVSLSQPAGAGGVTFDIATADNTATVADNDYVAASLTGQTIAQGAGTFTFA